MTQWLSGKQPLPSSFELGEECELREPGDEGGQVKVSRQELMSEETEVHLSGWQAGQQTGTDMG